MNEIGIWTGILNNKIGTFKFINVNIIEKFYNFLPPPPKTITKTENVEENIIIIDPNEINQYKKQQKLKLSKSLTFSSLFLSTTSLTSTNQCFKHSNNSNLNSINNNNNDNYTNFLQRKITESTLINEIFNSSKLKVFFFSFNFDNKNQMGFIFCYSQPL